MKLVYVPVMKCKCLCANDSFILYFGVIRLQIIFMFIYLFIHNRNQIANYHHVDTWYYRVGYDKTFCMAFSRHH